MNLRRTSAFWGIVLLVAAVAWYLVPLVHAQQGGNVAMSQRPEKRIDEKARVLDPNEEPSVRALADEIFNYPHVVPRMPSNLESDVKDRLVRAEVDFLAGRKPGVREEDIVLLVNTVSEKLKLPDFAKTSTKQIRALRMNMALASPVFMGRGMANGNMRVGESINSELSPLQAVHVIGVMIDQKFLDPHFQVLPQQWDQESHGKEIERIRERQALLEANPHVQHRIGTRDNPKRQDIQDALTQSTSSMDVGDAMSLIDTAFKTLGIQP
jgi:hypothetical protein